MDAKDKEKLELLKLVTNTQYGLVNSELFDIDISGCYGTGLKSLSEPIGSMTITDGESDLVIDGELEDNGK